MTKTIKVVLLLAALTVLAAAHGPTFPPDPWDPCLMPNPAPGCLVNQ
jgi:hypothetical protein